MSKKVIFLGNTCNYAFEYHQFFQQKGIISKAIIDYNGINRDFPSWHNPDFYQTKNIHLVNNTIPFSIPRKIISLKLDKENTVFHCFGIMSCIWPFILNYKFIYHGYGDILTTPKNPEKNLKGYIRRFLSKKILAKAKFVLVSQSTDIPELKKFPEISKRKLRYVNLYQKIQTTHVKEDLFHENEKVIFIPTRHEDFKNTHLFLKLLIIQIRERSLNPSQIKIITIRWGSGFKKVLDLIHEEKMEEYFLIKPLMKKKEFLGIMKSADIIVNEFTEFSDIPSFFGGISREAAMMGKPLITQINSSYMELFYSQKPPIDIISNYSDLESVINKFLNFSKDNLDKIGTDLINWYDQEYNPEKIFLETNQIHDEVLYPRPTD